MRWLAIGTVAILLVGCASAVPAAAPTALPDGVTVTAYQGRFDRAERQLELKVTNGSDATITVTSATFESSRFATLARWDRPQDIPSGSARDLRVRLGAPDCSDSPDRDDVVVEFTLADSSTGTARLALDDVSVIDAINAEDCLAEAITTLVTIRPADRLGWTAGARAPATLEVAVTPTGVIGSVSITETRATVLLSLVDDGGAVVFSQPENVVVDADSTPAVIRLRLVPARCDPHAVAEDKRGTIFSFEAQTSDGHAGQIVVPVSDVVRGELYAFYGDYCALP